MSGKHSGPFARIRAMLFLALLAGACSVGAESKKASVQEPPFSPRSPGAPDPSAWPTFRCDAGVGTHKPATAVAILTSDDRGSNHCALYDVFLFSDGCYYVRNLLAPRLTRTGRTSRQFAASLLRDSETYALASFYDDLRIRESGCPVTLTFNLGGTQKRIRLDPVLQPHDCERAKERGEDFRQQLVIADLLSKRLEGIIYIEAE